MGVLNAVGSCGHGSRTLLGFESIARPGTLFTMSRSSKQRIFSVSPMAIRETSVPSVRQWQVRHLMIDRYSKQRIFSVSPMAIRETSDFFDSPMAGTALDDR